mmetsp:Transcript_28141/g.47700  ORF Transcript_28141/g.47700 Transcript_28141/m.47700 type:complete len:107 (+) Transcript_28141:586-906(+)
MAISATLIDGLVLARAHMHNSVNYRSVVIFADTVHVITDKEEKDKGLRIITEHVLKGRWDDPDARNPNKAERDSTVLIFTIIAVTAIIIIITSPSTIILTIRVSFF